MKNRKEEKLFDLSDAEKMWLCRQTGATISEIESIGDELESQAKLLMENVGITKQQLRHYLENPPRKTGSLVILF